MQENFRVKRKKLYFGFVDLEKAFDRVPREVIRWAMRKLGIEEWLVSAVMSMLSVDGDADAAVEARIRIGWNKFRQLVPLLTNRNISLIRKGRL